MNPRVFTGLLATVLSILPSFAVAQAHPGDEYLQFRSASGLPGGGFAVSPTGEIGIQGAMGFSTPVAYSLGRLKGIAQLSNMSPDSKLRWPDTGGHNEQGNGNGTASLLFGYPLGNVRTTFSRMVLSGLGDSALNFHFQIPLPAGRTAAAVGVQDFVGHAGNTSEGTSREGDLSRSLYAVATHDFGRGAYLSAGLGTIRFRRSFASASVPLGHPARAFVEHDGYGWNYGAGVGLGPVVVTVGKIRGQYTFWSVGVRF